MMSKQKALSAVEIDNDVKAEDKESIGTG